MSATNPLAKTNGNTYRTNAFDTDSFPLHVQIGNPHFLVKNIGVPDPFFGVPVYLYEGSGQALLGFRVPLKWVPDAFFRVFVDKIVVRTTIHPNS